MKPIEVMTQDQKDDAVVETLLGWERDLFFHRINKARYERILQDDKFPASQRAKISNLLDEVTERIEELEAYKRSIQPELPSEERMQNAVARFKAASPEGAESPKGI